MISRRVFLRNGALTAVGLSMVPGFLERAAMAAPQAGRRKTLVVVFQRGAADGLNIVVPFGERAYYAHRPTIAIPAPGSSDDAALDLDGFFGLHPALGPLHGLYREGRFAVVNAVGMPDTGGRSHFQAQDFMESATPGNRNVTTGWLNRYLSSEPDPMESSFRAAALAESMPKALRGPAPALSVRSLADFSLPGGFLYESLYSGAGNTLLTGAAREMFDGMRQLEAVRLADHGPAPGVNYGANPANPGEFGSAMMQIAQLIKADVGLQVAFVDVRGGWDTHSDEAARLADLLQTFGRGLATFHQDLGDRMEDVVVVTMSEFGRTARENGSGGTDHGHANFMFVTGGPVRGGRVYSGWPGLEPEQLNENRDLALTVDFRDVLGELLVGHLGCEDTDSIFPGYGVDSGRFLGIL